VTEYIKISFSAGIRLIILHTNPSVFWIIIQSLANLHFVLRNETGVTHHMVSYHLNKYIFQIKWELLNNISRVILVLTIKIT
jgi:hypothetical protein